MGEPRGRRRYDREFKEGAVRLILGILNLSNTRDQRPSQRSKNRPVPSFVYHIEVFSGEESSFRHREVVALRELVTYCLNQLHWIDNLSPELFPLLFYHSLFPSF